jgi:arabinan endo-1,5-alpha-L-arabinosidase
MKIPRLITRALAAATLLSTTCAMHAQQGDIVHVHDPAIIREGDTYYLFSTGHGVPIRTSTDLKTWKRAGRVFAEDAPAWSREEVEGAVFPWAPAISYFNGRFHLYYSVSTFGSQRSIIGLATNRTLDPGHPDHRWTDHRLVIDSRPGRDAFNAIDAAIVLDEEEQPWLAWGSFHWGVRFPGGIMILPLDRETGLVRPGAEAESIAGRPGIWAIEAPAITRRGEFYYLFVSFDYCCRGIESTYKIMVGRSKNVNGPYMDKEGRAMLDGGGTLVLQGDGERIRGPGHNEILAEGDDFWLVHHFYDAANRGLPTLQIRPLSWTDDGWPEAGAPITPLPDRERSR